MYAVAELATTLAAPCIFRIVNVVHDGVSCTNSGGASV